MNNLRLLAGLALAILPGCAVCAGADSGRVLTLDEVFASAETNSVRLRPSLTAEDEADTEIGVARNARLPEINANLSLSFIGDGFTTKRNFTDYSRAPIPHFGSGLNLNITQPVYAGGAITAGIEMAELKSTAARFATELNRDGLRFQLTGYYIDIYKYDNLRRVVENNIVQVRKMLDDMQAKYEQGVALRNDITRYELLLSNLELRLIKINNTLDILKKNLIVTAGLPDDTTFRPDTTMLDRALPTAGETWWQQSAVENAPSLKLARSGVDISRKAETLVRSERLPKIGLQAGWTIDGPILVEVPPINRNLSYWYVGVGVSYNLSSLYKTNKSLARSRLGVRKATEELDAALENVALNVNSDYTRYLEAYEDLKTCTKSVELADRNYVTVSTRYKADMAIITDLLDAENSLLDARTNLVNARINIIYYYYKLLFTTGQI